MDLIRLCPVVPPTVNLTELAEPVQTPVVYVPESAVISLVPSPEPKVISTLEILAVEEDTVKKPPA